MAENLRTYFMDGPLVKLDLIYNVYHLSRANSGMQRISKLDAI